MEAKKALPTLWTKEERTAWKKGWKSGFSKRNRTWNSNQMGRDSIYLQRMNAIKALKPKEFTEWARWYWMEVGTFNIMSLSEKWAGITGLTLEQAYNEIIIHLVDEPWDGHQAEERIMEILRERAGERFLIEETAGLVENHWKVDVTVRDKETNQIIEGFQVKSKGFWLSPNCGYDRVALRKRLTEAEVELQYPIWLIVKEEMIDDGNFRRVNWRELTEEPLNS